MTPKPATEMNRVREMILETLPSGAKATSVIYGPGGLLDSLGLVSFLADLEYRISEELDREILLASEQAMSRSRSPFRDVPALTEHISELLAK